MAEKSERPEPSNDPNIAAQRLLQTRGSGRMVLADARLDPILHVVDERLSLWRFHVRPYNEELLLDLIPGNVLGTHDWVSFCREPQDILIPGWDESIAARCLRLGEDASLRHQIYLPTDHKKELPTSFFWCIEGDGMSAGLSSRLCELQNAQPFATTRKEFFDLSKRSADLVPSKDTGVSFDFIGESGHYKIGFHILAVDGIKPTLKASFVPQALALSLESAGAFRLAMLVDVYLLEPLIGGRRTSTFRVGTLALAFDGRVPINLGMRVMCCLASQSDIPAGKTRQRPPQYHQIRYSTINVANERWEIDEEHAPWFTLRAALVVVGNVPSDLCIAFFQGHARAAKMMGVITTDPALCRALSKNPAFRLIGRPSAHRVLFSSGNREIAVLKLSDFAVNDTRLEEFMIFLLERYQAISDAAENDSWSDTLAGRLPPLPICRDDGLDAISVLLLGNTQRGRIPPDSATMARDVFKDPSYWLFPVNAEIVNQEDLVVELTVRLAAEYLGVRCFSELFGGVFELARPARQNELRERTDIDEVITRSTGEIFEELFSSWQRGVDAWTAPESTSRLRQELAGRGLKPEDILKGLALAAYSTFAIETSAETWRLSHLNPLVLALLPTPESAYDARLHAEAAGLSTFAARLSALKPAGILLRWIPTEVDETVMELQAELRSLFHQSPTNDVLDEILGLRISLGACAAICMGRVLSSLDRLGADRILAFSNIPLDFIPYRGSILGLDRAYTV